jgi:tRNA U38,U39,U40 pseudouridine synthase TruA
MVSIQIEVGQGRKEPEIITRYLEGKLEGMIQGLAPPHGLILTKVHYREDAGE